MARFAVSIHIDAPPERVWDVLADWEGSAAWMVDATVVEVVGTQREGVGTRVRAVTRIAGVPLTDKMIVTRWEPGSLIQVIHVGWPIRGPAWFELTPEGGGTLFHWVEELDPPLGPVGEAGARLLRRPIEGVLLASARRFANLVVPG
jgi:uncharacterized protein YndB with AHSA1/START domain